MTALTELTEEVIAGLSDIALHTDGALGMLATSLADDLYGLLLHVEQNFDSTGFLYFDPMAGESSAFLAIENNSALSLFAHKFGIATRVATMYQNETLYYLAHAARKEIARRVDEAFQNHVGG